MPMPFAEVRSGGKYHAETGERRSCHALKPFSQLKALLRRCDMLVCMGVFGAFSMLAAVVFVVIIQRNVGEEMVGDFSEVRTIPVEIAAYAIEPWNPKNCIMVLWDELLVIFVLRRYVFQWMANRFYSEQPDSKKAKIANYMLELLVMNTAIAISLWCGFFRLLFSPSSFHHPTKEQGDRLFIGAQQVANLYISTYVIQMCFDRQVRTGLVMHHWSAFLLCIWGTAALYCLGYDVLMTRAFFCLFLYVLTEQNVFIEMLLYQRKMYMPRLFYFSAWYYLLTRIFIAVYVIICWLDMFEDVFQNHNHNIWVGYSMWAAIPVINLILNVTQWTTVTSLFGIARQVKKRCNDVNSPSPSMKAVESPLSMKKLESVDTMSTCATVRSLQSSTSSRLNPVEEQEPAKETHGSNQNLLDVVAEIDFKQRGMITLSDWMQYLGSTCFDDTSIPLRVFGDIFEEMRGLCNAADGVTPDVFISYFSQFMVGAQADFDLTLCVLVLQKAHALADGDLTLQATLRQKHRDALKRLLREQHVSTAIEGAVVSDVEATSASPPVVDMYASGGDEELSDFERQPPTL